MALVLGHPGLAAGTVKEDGGGPSRPLSVSVEGYGHDDQQHGHGHGHEVQDAGHLWGTGGKEVRYVNNQKTWRVVRLSFMGRDPENRPSHTGFS